MKLKTVFLVLAILFLIIGLAGMFIGHSTSSTMAMIEGLGKGLAGVFFVLWYILVLLGKEPTDETANH